MYYLVAYFYQYLPCNTIKSQTYVSTMQNCKAECAEVFAPLDHDSNTSCDIQRVLTEAVSRLQ